jgi:exodeoxyribonuclease VII small subunit
MAAKTMEPTPPARPAPEQESFDALLRQLQSIVERLENADLALEDSLQAFERGIQLAQRGQAILDAAEKRVEILLRDGKTAPWDPELPDS